MPPQPRAELGSPGQPRSATKSLCRASTHYQMHWRSGISRLVYQKPVIRVKPLWSSQFSSAKVRSGHHIRSHGGLEDSHDDLASMSAPLPYI